MEAQRYRNTELRAFSRLKMFAYNHLRLSYLQRLQALKAFVSSALKIALRYDSEHL